MLSMIKRAGLYLIALVLLVFTGYPFVYMIATSLKTQTYFFRIPRPYGPTLCLKTMDLFLNWGSTVIL